MTLLQTVVHDPVAMIFGAVAAFVVSGALVVAAPRLRALPPRDDADEDGASPFRALFENHPDAVVAIGLDRKITGVNAAMERLCGYRADELIGHAVIDLAPMQDHFERRGLAATFAYDAPGTLHGTLCPKGEPSIPVSIVTIPIRESGNAVGLYAIVSDASERMRLEFREATQRERLATVADVMSRYAGRPDEQVQELLRFAVHSLAADGGAVSFQQSDVLRVEFTIGAAPAVGNAFDFSKTFARLTFGSDHVIAISDTHEPKWRDDPATRLHGWDAYIGRTVYAHSEPVGILSIVNAHRRAYPFDQADCAFVRIVASLIGASLERTRLDGERLSRHLTDDLTGLPNHTYFTDHLDGTLARVRRTGGRVAMHFIDLDGFKAVRAAHGDDGADEVVRMFAARLRTLVRNGEFVARLGVDEFAVLQDPALSDAEATRLGAQIVDAAAGPMLFDGARIDIGASVGIALFPTDAEDREQLVSRAEEAMRAAKGRGRGCTVLYRLQ